MKTIPNKISVSDINLACKILRGGILIDFYNSTEGFTFVALLEGNVTVVSVKGISVTRLPVKLTNIYKYPIKSIYTSHEIDKDIIVLTTEDNNELTFYIQKDKKQENEYQEFTLFGNKDKITKENLRDFEKSLPLKRLVLLNGSEAVERGFTLGETGYLYQRKEDNYFLVIIPVIYEVDERIKGEKIRDRLIYQSMGY